MISCLLHAPWPTTGGMCPAGNRISELFVCKPALNPLSHTSQDYLAKPSSLNYHKVVSFPPEFIHIHTHTHIEGIQNLQIICDVVNLSSGQF